MEVIFITGASGSGKTTLLKKLEEDYGTEFKFYYFDSVGVPSTDEMNEQFGSGEEWQRQTTVSWLERILSECRNGVAILDGQMRLSFITEACNARGFTDYRIILIDCNDSIRTRRLHQRGQPELANKDMMNWSKYLRNEASQIGAQILDTSSQNVSESESALLRLIKS